MPSLLFKIDLREVQLSRDFYLKLQIRSSEIPRDVQLLGDMCKSFIVDGHLLTLHLCVTLARVEAAHFVLDKQRCLVVTLVHTSPIALGQQAC